MEIKTDAAGLLKSVVFPGLWLDAEALLRGDVKLVLVKLRAGINSHEHRAFISSTQ